MNRALKYAILAAQEAAADGDVLVELVGLTEEEQGYVRLFLIWCVAHNRRVSKSNIDAVVAEWEQAPDQLTARRRRRRNA